MREALSEFPRNYEIMNNLARALFYLRDDEGFPKEVISLCERIIRDCRNNATVSSAINTLARTYALTGDSEKAQKYANMLPPMEYSRERALEWALEGEERNERLQTDTLQYLLLLTEKMGGRLGWEAGPFRSYENDPPSSEQIISICQTLIDVLKVIFPDENYLLLNGRIAEAYRRMALEYACMRDRDKTMETLLLCEKYGDKFDEDAKKNLKYTSIFFDRLHFDGSELVRHGDKNENARTLRKLEKWDCFNFMRSDKEFKELCDRIRKKAGKE